jgi:hypothetical protein
MARTATTKPTINTRNAAQMRAVQHWHEYVVAPVLGQPGVWSVRKEGNPQPYRVDLHHGTCNCPARTQVCRHLELVRLKTALLQNRPAPAPVLPTPSPAPRPMTAEQRREAFFAPD